MFTTVKFLSQKYGNYLDNYYTDDYEGFIDALQSEVISSLTAHVNLGVTDGIIIENNFKGDFQDVNCAIVESSYYGTHLYKIIKRVFIKRDLWRITMIKDLVSERYNEIINSKVLVSRLGINRREFNPILFMEEPIVLSEVKKEQVLLNELKNTKSYGYLAIWKRNSLDGTIEWDTKARGQMYYDIEVDSLSQLESYNFRNIVNQKRDVEILWRIVTGSAGNWGESLLVKLYREENNNYNVYTTDITNSGIDLDTEPYIYTTEQDMNNGLINANVKNLLKYYGYTIIDNGNTVRDLGKIVYVTTTEKYYEIQRELVTKNTTYDLDGDDINHIMGNNGGMCFNGCPKVRMEEKYYKQKYVEIDPTPVVQKTLSEYDITVDQPFQMMFIPMIEDGLVKYNNNLYRTDKIQIENMLYDLIAMYGGENSKLVDVQVIPYSPIDGYHNMWNENTQVLDIGDRAKDIIIIKDTTIIPMFQVDYAQYMLSIEYKLDVEDYKVSQKHKYLLTSPSGATPYEFSLSKNKGLEGFIIKVDLRPYASYYQIQPIFKGLYGNNYTDTRGLVWKEDMSLTLISDAFETYKRQNINYLNSFNSEVDFQRSQLALTHEANWGNYGFDAGKRMIEATVEAATFAADAVAKDTFFGAKGGISGGAGALAIVGGAIASEAIEAGQLAYNNKMDKKLLANSLTQKRDQFNYNIGNIKAIPENIEKVSGIYGTNNYIPYLQVFAPTDDEIEYFNDYLDTYGINVGMMVDLTKFDFDLLQGTIVKFNGIITQEEYEEIIDQLARGIRKVE